MRKSGEVAISPFPQVDLAQQYTESHNAGKLSMPDGSAIIGMRVVSEDVVVFSESYVQVEPFPHTTTQREIEPTLTYYAVHSYLSCRS
jgi:hypothetical protein